MNTELYPVEILSDTIHAEISTLMKECIDANCVPYIQDEPLPQDMNVINGRHLGDINKVYLELKAAKMGAKSLKWIYGADAAMLGLEKKNNAEDMIVILGNVRGRVEAQSVYLLDQFTYESVKNVFELLKNNEDKKIKTLAQQFVKNITEYDTGRQEEPVREKKWKNISANLTKPECIKRVKTAFQNVTVNYSEEQKYIFSVVNDYYIKQELGKGIRENLSEAEKERLINSLKKISGDSSPRLAVVLTESFLYAQRMTHYEFSPEYVFSQDDYSKKLSVSAPAASHFEPKQDSIALDKSFKQQQKREHTIKPRHITHQRRF